MFVVPEGAVVVRLRCQGWVESQRHTAMEEGARRKEFDANSIHGYRKLLIAWMFEDEIMGRRILFLKYHPLHYLPIFPQLLKLIEP